MKRPGKQGKARSPARRVRTRAPASPIADAETLDKVVLLMISGMPAATVEKTCSRSKDLKGFGLDPANVPRVIQEAKRMIRAAALRDRKEDFGEAIKRLNDLYSRCLREADTATALGVQREMNKLVGLYEVDSSGDDEFASDADELREQHQAALAYLTPLRLAATGAPLSELARLAVARIVQLTGLGGGKIDGGGRPDHPGVPP